MPTPFNYIETKKARGDALKRAEQLHEKASDEQRDLTAGERRDFDSALATAEQLSGRLEREGDIRRALAGGQAATLGDRKPGEFRSCVAQNLQRIASMKGAVSRDLLDFDAEQRDLVSTGGFSGLLPTDYQPVWEMLLPHAAALRCGVTTLDTEKHSITLPNHTALPTFAWLGEGGTIPVADPTGTTTVYTPTKVASMDKISREMADDANTSVVNMVLNRIAIALGLGIDLAVFEGLGSSNQPQGLKTLAGTQSVSMATNGALLTTLDPFANAIGLLETANAKATAICMHPRSWAELLLIKELTSTSNKPIMQASAGAGSQGVENSIYGVPVYLSTQLSVTETQGTSGAVCSSAYVFQADQVIMIRSHAVRLEADTGPFFSTDQIAVRGAARVAVAVPSPLAVCRIKGIL